MHTSIRPGMASILLAQWHGCAIIDVTTTPTKSKSDKMQGMDSLYGDADHHKDTNRKFLQSGEDISGISTTMPKPCMHTRPSGIITATGKTKPHLHVMHRP